MLAHIVSCLVKLLKLFNWIFCPVKKMTCSVTQYTRTKRQNTKKRGLSALLSSTLHLYCMFLFSKLLKYDLWNVLWGKQDPISTNGFLLARLTAAEQKPLWFARTCWLSDWLSHSSPKQNKVTSQEPTLRSASNARPSNANLGNTSE